MEAICLDLDNVLVRYRTEQVRSTLFDVLARRLVHMGHSDMILDALWKSRALEFAQVGRVLDCEHGTILTLGISGDILSASYGFFILSEDEIKALYGPNPQYYLRIGESRLQGKYWAFLTHLESTFPAVFTICVEMIARQQTLGISVQRLESDLDQVVSECLDAATVPTFYQALYTQPGRYFCADLRLGEMLRDFKRRENVVILVTNESEKYVNFVCRYVLGADWKSVFDEIIPAAGKPHFFSNAEFLREKYSKFTFTSLGCHFMNDIFAPKKYLRWKTIAILPETQLHTAEVQSSYWLEFITLYADAMHPSLESYLLN